MRMGFNLTLEQTQKLIMTQELQQAIKILQLPALELREYIQQQLETNPLIEARDEDCEELTSEAGEELIAQLLKNAESSVWDRDYHDDTDNDYSYENYVASRTTLRDHLLFQLHITIMCPKRKKIGRYIIESLDDNGYLTANIDDIAKDLNAEPDEVEKVLAVIQTFDPAGIACRDIKECLLIQLQAKGINDPVIEELIKNHLESLGDKRFNFIAKELNISTSEVQRLYDIIKALEPKPGRAFQGCDDVKYINPDVMVKKIDNEYLVLVNDSTAPRLNINSYYQEYTE
jgi:RNA polymerase sigma-54 factor